MARREILTCDRDGVEDDTVRSVELGVGPYHRDGELCGACIDDLHIPLLVQIIDQYGDTVSRPAAGKATTRKQTGETRPCPSCGREVAFGKRGNLLNHLTKVDGLTIAQATRLAPPSEPSEVCNVCDGLFSVLRIRAHKRKTHGATGSS